MIGSPTIVGSPNTTAASQFEIETFHHTRSLRPFQ